MNALSLSFLLLVVPLVTSTMVNITEEDFGTFNSEPVKKFTWRNKNGFSVSVISYGVTIQSIMVPDRHGVEADVVLGFEDFEGYLNRNSPYLGASIGRCANRIAGATFSIDGVSYQLAKNVGGDHLHGGLVGFDKVNWKSRVEGSKVTFTYLSKDGEEGYPGDLLTSISIEVADDNTLRIIFQATTTKKTVVNLTNHAYFNLPCYSYKLISYPARGIRCERSFEVCVVPTACHLTFRTLLRIALLAGHGAGAEELYNHVINMNANKITETDSNSIPTGKFVDVGGTSFDLRAPRRLGDVMGNDNLFDDNFCVATSDVNELNFVARVVHPSSGRFLEVHSNQPGVQLYTANFLPSAEDPALVGKDQVGYRRHGAFCLETQKYPDAVHHQHFPSTFLAPGELYKHEVLYRFGAVSV